MNAHTFDDALHTYSDRASRIVDYRRQTVLSAACLYSAFCIPYVYMLICCMLYASMLGLQTTNYQQPTTNQFVAAMKNLALFVIFNDHHRVRQSVPCV